MMNEMEKSNPRHDAEKMEKMTAFLATLQKDGMMIFDGNALNLVKLNDPTQNSMLCITTEHTSISFMGVPLPPTKFLAELKMKRQRMTSLTPLPNFYELWENAIAKHFLQRGIRSTNVPKLRAVIHENILKARSDPNPNGIHGIMCEFIWLEERFPLEDGKSGIMLTLFSYRCGFVVHYVLDEVNCDGLIKMMEAIINQEGEKNMKTPTHLTEEWNERQKKMNAHMKALLLSGDLDNLSSFIRAEVRDTHPLRCNECKTVFTTDGDEPQICPKCQSTSIYPCDFVEDALRWASKMSVNADAIHTFPRFFCNGCKHFDPITKFIHEKEVNASFCGLYNDVFEQADEDSNHFTSETPVDLACHEPKSSIAEDYEQMKRKLSEKIAFDKLKHESDAIEALVDSGIQFPPPDNSNEDLDTVYEVSGRYEQCDEWHNFNFKVPKGLPKSFKSKDDAGEFQIVEFGMNDLLLSFHKHYLMGRTEFLDGVIYDEYTISYEASYKETVNGDKVYEGVWENRYYVRERHDIHGNNGKCRLVVHLTPMK